MRVIARPRRGGKTTEAVKWVKEDPERVLLVINHHERQRVIREFDIPPRQVVVADGAEQRLRGRQFTLGIDNIDLLTWQTIMDLAWFRDRLELVTETR